jgi:hypothetical protein
MQEPVRPPSYQSLLGPFLLRLMPQDLDRSQAHLQASVFMSLANLLAHWLGLSMLRCAARADDPDGPRLRVAARLWMLEWAASALFHARDAWITER